MFGAPGVTRTRGTRIRKSEKGFYTELYEEILRYILSCSVKMLSVFLWYWVIFSWVAYRHQYGHHFWNDGHQYGHLKDGPGILSLSLTGSCFPLLSIAPMVSWGRGPKLRTESKVVYGLDWNACANKGPPAPTIHTRGWPSSFWGFPILDYPLSKKFPCF
jgi:hypothetical protein